MANYIAVVHKDIDTDFGVSFPDFPGCITAGQTIDDAKELAREALSFHIKGMLEDGDPLPEPSKLEEIMGDADYANAVAYLVVSVSDVRGRIGKESYENVCIDQKSTSHSDLPVHNLQLLLFPSH